MDALILDLDTKPTVKMTHHERIGLSGKIAFDSNQIHALKILEIKGHERDAEFMVDYRDFLIDQKEETFFNSNLLKFLVKNQNHPKVKPYLDEYKKIKNATLNDFGDTFGLSAWVSRMVVIGGGWVLRMYPLIEDVGENDFALVLKKGTQPEFIF